MTEEPITPRVRDRREQVRLQAIRSREFTTEQLTRQAVNFLIFGISVEKQREDIIQSVKRR